MLHICKCMTSMIEQNNYTFLRRCQICPCFVTACIYVSVYSIYTSIGCMPLVDPAVFRSWRFGGGDTWAGFRSSTSKIWMSTYQGVFMDVDTLICQYTPFFFLQSGLQLTYIVACTRLVSKWETARINIVKT